MPLRHQYPNLMLRIMRAMRTMQIELASWRFRYIKLFCACVILSPECVPPLGGVRHIRKHCAIAMQIILHDHFHTRWINGVCVMSMRMEARMRSLERTVREHTGLIEID
jgi:hypothetical protein